MQSLMMATILNQLGYNRNFPHAVAFAPAHVFGIGLVNLCTEQGLFQLQALLDYMGTEHKVGNVMLIILRHLQVEAGVSFDLLSQPSIPLVYLTDYWILYLRRFCATRGIVTLRVSRNSRVPSPVRVGDQILMDVALTLGFSRRELIDLNFARIYLRATTVSDISSADGRALRSWTWHGQRIPNRYGLINFFRQPPPTPA